MGGSGSSELCKTMTRPRTLNLMKKVIRVLKEPLDGRREAIKTKLGKGKRNADRLASIE